MNLPDWWKNHMPNWFEPSRRMWDYMESVIDNPVKLNLKENNLHAKTDCDGDDKMHKYCKQISEFDDTDNNFYSGMASFVKGLHNEIDMLRTNPTSYKAKPNMLRWAVQEIEDNWEGETYGKFTWSESLARAGRQVLNEMGACQTLGDSYSNYFDEALRKYYAYSVDGLQVMKFFSDKLVDTDILENSPRKTMNWLLSQQCIDKSILRTLSAKHIGIACSCAGDDSAGTGISGYNCYIAVANDIKPRFVTSQIPEYQDFPVETSCSYYCVQDDFSLAMSYDYKSNFMVESCPNDEVVTQAKFCKKCDELTPGCSVCSDYDFKNFFSRDFQSIIDSDFDDQDVCLQCTGQEMDHMGWTYDVGSGNDEYSQDQGTRWAPLNDELRFWAFNYAPSGGFMQAKQTCGLPDCAVTNFDATRCTQCRLFDYPDPPPSRRELGSYITDDTLLDDDSWSVYYNNDTK